MVVSYTKQNPIYQLPKKRYKDALVYIYFLRKVCMKYSISFDVSTRVCITSDIHFCALYVKACSIIKSHVKMKGSTCSIIIYYEKCAPKTI